MKKNVLILALMAPIVMFAQQWDWVKDNGTVTVISKAKVKSNSTGDLFSAYSNSFQPTTLILKRETTNGSLVWSKTIGGMNTFLQDISVDMSNNSYIMGQFANNLILPDTTLTNSGSYETFIVAYTSAGVRKWVKVLPVGYNGGNFILNDKTGNLVYVSTGAVGTNSITLVKYSSAGAQLWMKNYNSTSGLNGLAIDAQNNIHVSGTFTGSLTLNGTTYFPASSSYPAASFIAKFNTNGDLKKVHTYPGLVIRDFGMDSTSVNYYVTGVFSDSAMVGQTKIKTACSTNTNSPAICEESFIAKVDTNNVSSWAQRNLADFMRLEVSASGSSYLTGGFRDSLVLGSVKLKETQNRRAIFVAKINTTGVASWALKDSVSNLATTDVEEIAYSSIGAAYIIGNYHNVSGNTWFGTQSLPPLTGTAPVAHYFSAKINENASTGIAMIGTDATTVKIYPNPNNGRFIVEGKVSAIYNVLGQKTDFTINPNSNEVRLEAPQGIYFVETLDKEKKRIQKIIVE